MAEGCDKSLSNLPAPPFPAVLPRGVTLPAGDSALVANFNDTDFGYLRITIDLANNIIAGEMFTVDLKPEGAPKLFDSFELNLESHKLH
jgi:hypothetical protein